MKIVIAPDSFKGTLTAYEAALTIAEAFTGAADEIIQLPVADGGESTLSCFRSAIGGNYVDVNVANPYMERITAKYLLSGDTAVVEVAEAAGLTLVEGRKNVRLTTSYGVGELIKAALDAGAKKIYVAVGGSATNDGGAGLAAALGVKFTDTCTFRFWEKTAPSMSSHRKKARRWRIWNFWKAEWRPMPLC